MVVTAITSQVEITNMQFQGFQDSDKMEQIDNPTCNNKMLLGIKLELDPQEQPILEIQ